MHAQRTLLYSSQGASGALSRIQPAETLLNTGVSYRDIT